MDRMNYTVVTGAAGFIGSNLVKALNERGVTNILAVDNLARADKFANLVGCEIADYLDKRDFIDRMDAGEFDGALDAVLHQGACSDTMETDGRYMMENNYATRSTCSTSASRGGPVPLRVVGRRCTAAAGISASRRNEAPLNVYGYSKYLFDQVVRRRLPEASSQVAGFRYFNVYGPNEAHKGRMASVAYHFFNQYRSEGKVRLFRAPAATPTASSAAISCQSRTWSRSTCISSSSPRAPGIFNVGTGRRRPSTTSPRASSTPAGGPPGSQRSLAPNSRRRARSNTYRSPRR